MVLDKLGESIQNALKKLINMHHIDENLINEIIKDIQKSLIVSDVDIKLVLKFSKNIKERALNEIPKNGINIKEHVLKIVYEELISIIGSTKQLALEKQKIMLVGLQGSGKTTTIVKLAHYYKKHGLTSCVIGADTFRPGAYHQLKKLCDDNNISFYGELNEKNPIFIIKNGLEKCQKYDLILIDTAGRHSLEENLINEIIEINNEFKPKNKFLVLDASIGQMAKAQANSFNESIGITGIIITKLDGTAKGGGALSAVSETNTPIMFIGTGENINDLEKFNPDGFISRLLGLGDIKLLLDKIKENINEKEIKTENIMSGKFTLNDMYNQLETINKIGSLKQIFKLLPFGNFGNRNITNQELEKASIKMNKYKVIMDSMTKKEKENPKTIDNRRQEKIAIGSGVCVDDVKELLKQHKTMQNMIKTMSSNMNIRGLYKLINKKNK